MCNITINVSGVLPYNFIQNLQFHSILWQNGPKVLIDVLLTTKTNDNIYIKWEFIYFLKCLSDTTVIEQQQKNKTYNETIRKYWC